MPRFVQREDFLLKTVRFIIIFLRNGIWNVGKLTNIIFIDELLIVFISHRKYTHQALNRLFLVTPLIELFLGVNSPTLGGL